MAAAAAAPPPPRLSNSLPIPLLLSLIVVASPSLVWAREHPAKYHIVDTESLPPRSSCSIPTGRSQSRVTVVHRHGPCSPLASRDDTPSHVELLHQDQARVDSIHHRAAGTEVVSMAATLPASTGTDLGTGNYIVTIGLGTPSKDYSVVFDTGSDLTWVQCLPCQNCYSQRDPLFDPTQSSTFGYIPCSSSYCSNLAQPSCSTNSTCQYDVQYGDNSQTEGSFVQDTLKFSSDSIPNFRFGCGHDNSGLFGKAGGLLGLGRDSVSLVSQTAQQYGKTFSYCLPSRSSNTGYLILGTGNEGGVQFTPMLTDSSLPSFYFLKLVGISSADRNFPCRPPCSPRRARCWTPAL
ncbi:hypothetical protein HPP92_018929 [Vanilla planifolia]|uniref:Peptidase A1 domain-containing protein n=1 Tax=Vanilla planifolia TaxID=51239 RepID=A0A835UL90_VANPL|nr:hypothetical protein HPP92_018929 [Vanilla planifolia]